MNVLGYTESGAIRVIFDGDEGESTVPDDMGNRHRVMIAEWESQGNTIPPYIPPPIIEPPVTLCEVAGARLVVDQNMWQVTGVERSTGIAGADLIDVDHVIVFFTEPQMDNFYEVIPSIGVTKHNEFVEVSRPNLSELNFIVQRVQ